MNAIEHEAAGVAATLAATGSASLPCIEIVEERRRAHDAAFRARVVAESSVPGSRVQDVARRHGICSSLIYRWRRATLGPVLKAPSVRLLPVRVADAHSAEARASRGGGDAKRSGLIEIELDNGLRVRVDAEVNLAALRRVMAALRG